MLRSTRWLTYALLSVALFDEMSASVSAIGLPLVRLQLGLSYTQLALLLSVGGLLALIFEPLLSLLSDRGSKRWWVISGLALQVASYVLAALAHSFVWLLIAFMLLNIAGGLAVGLSQASLVDLWPGESTKATLRWTLLSSFGDVLAPLGLGLLLGWGLGWMGLCLGAALGWLLVGLAILPGRFPVFISAAPGEEHSSWRRLRAAMRDQVLLRWTLVALISSMLDEVFVSFATLYLHDTLRIEAAHVALMMLVPMLGSLLSLLVLERFLQGIEVRRLLFWLSLLTLGGLLLLVLARGPGLMWEVVGGLFVIGLGSGGWYPLAKGAMYARLPGRSGTVRAIAGLGHPLELALPILAGLLATSAGPLAVILVLGTAPLLVLIVTPWQARSK